MNKSGKLCSTRNFMQFLRHEQPLGLSRKSQLLRNSDVYLSLFKRARHRILSWTRWIQPALSNSNYLRFILIFSSDLCLDFPSGLLSSAITVKMLHVSDLSSLRATCLWCLTCLGLISGEVIKLWRSSLCSCLHVSPTSPRHTSVEIIIWRFFFFRVWLKMQGKIMT